MLLLFTTFMFCWLLRWWCIDVWLMIRFVCALRFWVCAILIFMLFMVIVGGWVVVIDFFDEKLEFVCELGAEFIVNVVMEDLVEVI